jgi:GNAT superfamily N-acetyltransferase
VHDVVIDHQPDIMVREGSPEDFDRYFDEGFADLSAESRHFRFFTAVRELPPALRQHLRNVDGLRNAAVIAFDRAAQMADHPDGKPIGVARWMSGDDGPPELSITVIDAYQGMGVGGRLMDALLGLARYRGVHPIVLDVLRENTGMRNLVNKYRATVVRSGDPLVVRYRIDVVDPPLPVDTP